MKASFARWRSLNFTGFFHSAKRAPFELLGELLVAGAPRFVPDGAADLVERIGGGLDDMEGVQRDDRVRAALGDGPGDPLGVVAGDELDLLAALLAQQIEELLDRSAVAAGVRPHEPACVVVDDHGQVLLSLANRDLVEPQLRQVREQVATALGLGGDALADTADGPPRDPDRLTDRGLAPVDRQPRGLIVE